MTWNPQITAAFARGRGQFCIALAELEYDDLFTAVIEYDDRFPQPWSRTDIEREINAIAPPDSLSGGSDRFALLSHEGDFYITGPGSVQEKLPGAGLQSPDAVRGTMFGLGLVAGRLWAVGANEQVYRRDDVGQWTFREINLPSPPGFEKPRFGVVAGASEQDLYVAGLASPQSARLDPKVRERLMAGGASWAEWNAAHAAAKKAAPSAGLETEGRAIHWDGTTWSAITLPGRFPPTVKDILIEGPDRVWMVGSHGLILVGNAKSGFLDMGFDGDQQTLLSITRFQGRYIVASDYELHEFDGHMLSTIKPTLHRKGRPTPFKVQAVDDVMFYFDYKQGVHRWDGKSWEEIVIPKNLLQREFSGLGTRR